MYYYSDITKLFHLHMYGNILFLAHEKIDL